MILTVFSNLYDSIHSTLRRSPEAFNSKQFVTYPLLGCFQFPLRELALSLVGTGAVKGVFLAALDAAGPCSSTAGVREMAQTSHVHSDQCLAILLSSERKSPSSPRGCREQMQSELKQGAGRLRDSSCLSHPVASVKQCSRGVIVAGSERKAKREKMTAACCNHGSIVSRVGWSSFKNKCFVQACPALKSNFLVIEG